MDWIAIAKDFGFPICLCIVLLLAIRMIGMMLVKALQERIKTLETIVKTQGEQIVEIQNDRLVRAEAHAHELKDVAQRMASAMRDFASTLSKLLDFIGRQTDAINARPCMLPPEGKSKDPPSRTDLPPPPKAPTTDSYGNDRA